MAEAMRLIPRAELRGQLEKSGAGHVGRCYQCATCTSVCELSTPENAFPRKQMLLAQWGMLDQLAADPAVWLCHQCSDCSEHCPRDAKPGDVLKGMRAEVIRMLSFPRFIGTVVANARLTWPLMVFLPWLFWIVLLLGMGYYPVEAEQLLSQGEHGGFAAIAPHWLIYAIYFPIAGWVMLAAGIGGVRLWRMMGRGAKRRGSFMSGLIAVMMDIATHKSFGECKAKPSRRTPHLLLFWGFVGAAVTSGLLIVAIYIQKLPMPLPLWHPYKLLGNISAVLLVIGGIQLIVNRYGRGRALVSSNAFDNFFLGLVAAVIITGVATEAVRLASMPTTAFVIYTLHLGVVMALFLTFPYSKFAHMLYRALAQVHQRLTAGPEREQA
jgi:quinone-modifying oxidoreductase subunit QmoC